MREKCVVGASAALSTRRQQPAGRHTKKSFHNFALPRSIVHDLLARNI